MNYIIQTSPEDQSLVDKFNEEYSAAVVIVKRKNSNNDTVSSSKKINVYVDGFLQVMDEELLNKLIEIGFYVVVTRKPGW